MSSGCDYMYCVYLCKSIFVAMVTGFSLMRPFTNDICYFHNSCPEAISSARAWGVLKVTRQSQALAQAHHCLDGSEVLRNNMIPFPIASQV